jgi:hypothetical protein
MWRYPLLLDHCNMKPKYVNSTVPSSYELTVDPKFLS